MAYQDIKRGMVIPPIMFKLDLERAIEAVRLAHNQLAQEVIECHKRVQQFDVAISIGLTSIAVVPVNPLYSVAYYVGADFDFDNGGCWTTSKAKTGFMLNWKTATAGAKTARILIIE